MTLARRPRQYTGVRPINPPNIIYADRLPLTTDVSYVEGDIWLDRTHAESFQYNGAGQWIFLGSIDSGFPITPFVVGPVGKAGFQTIQSAIDACSVAGGGAVYIQTGNYTESLTLASGVSLVAVDPEGVIIEGIHTPPTNAGDISFSGIEFESATDIFSSAAAGIKDLIFWDCVFNVINGHTFNLVNWLGDIQIFNCREEGTANGSINNTAGASILVQNSELGSGTVQTLTYSGGSFVCIGSEIECPSTFGTNSVVSFETGTFISRTLATTGNAQLEFSGCNFSTGSTTCINHGSSGTIDVFNCVLNTSNASVFSGSGAGIITISGTSLADSTAFAGTLDVRTVATATGHINMSVGNATDFAGSATLVAGTVTVANTLISAQDLIFLSRQSVNGSTSTGNLVYTISAGASFTITSTQDATPGSTNTNDVSIVKFFIVRGF